MSPEQTQGRSAVVDHRSDVYSLGATLYELVTLQPAFPESNHRELLRKIADEEPRPPRQLHSRIPIDLETIILKAMRKEPAQRYATAGELAEDLQHWLDAIPIKARPPTLLDRRKPGDTSSKIGHAQTVHPPIV